VNANDLPWTGALAPAEREQDGRGLYLQHCASCHRDDRAGTPTMIPSLVGIEPRLSPAELSAIIQRGAGRMPGFPALGLDALSAIVEYLLTGVATPALNPS